MYAYPSPSWPQEPGAISTGRPAAGIPVLLWELHGYARELACIRPQRCDQGIQSVGSPTFRTWRGTGVGRLIRKSAGDEARHTSVRRPAHGLSRGAAGGFSQPAPAVVTGPGPCRRAQ